jgi:hypothetical protein
MWSQGLRDRDAHRVEELGGLRVGGGRGAAVGQSRPAVCLEGHLTSLPCATADLHGCLEQRELVGPCGEAAVSSKRVQLAHDRHERVIGCLHRKVIEVARAVAVAQRTPPARDLEMRRAQEQPVQALDRLVARTPGTAQRLDPTQRLGVGRRSSDRQRTSIAHRDPAQHGRARSSRGARMRAARSGAQPRSTSSSRACRSTPQSVASREAKPGANPAASSRSRRHSAIELTAVIGSAELRRVLMVS